MPGICLFFFLALMPLAALSQTVSQKLASAFTAFEKDSQLKHATTALYVTDAKTGKVLFEKNADLGLIPASTLKVITSASAYELLGSGFRYVTWFSYQTDRSGDTHLGISPSGDPSLGSWRWPETNEQTILQNLNQALTATGTRTIKSLYINKHQWQDETIPDGWLWQDIGNYYGAGAGSLNWRENQFDIVLRSGRETGSMVTIEKISPALYNYQLRSLVKAAAPGSGDSAYIYFPLQGTTATIRGTIPVNQNAFTISGAMPAPEVQFVHTWLATLQQQGVTIPNLKEPANDWQPTAPTVFVTSFSHFHSITSPDLNSLIYWFNRKSINLYGEAFIKTIGLNQTGAASTKNGLSAVQQFWQKNGISELELKMADGSGLSPMNRVTARAQVKVLQHARQQPWFSGFYESLPTLNGMKMKSGTMQGVKGFCGYYKNAAGNEYVFSFLVNNYSGSSADITRKMYKVLNAMK